jgi:dienelactone hydrolase
MKTKNLITVLIIFIMTMTTTLFAEKSSTSKIKEQIITYSVGNIDYKGFLAYVENLKGTRPAILIVPEWWGLNDYTKMRARKLAELGYVAFAVDMFGNGKIAENPTEAQSLTKSFYSNPQLSKLILEAALVKIKALKETDGSKILAIGYCFGGSVVLNCAKLGMDFKGVVSFHGGLKGVPADKNLLKAKILVCHGGDDKFVSQSDVNTFKHHLDSIGADYKLIVYPNATHAFTNPASTETGKKFNMPIAYNEKADKDSWNDMKLFFKSILK